VPRDGVGLCQAAGLSKRSPGRRPVLPLSPARASSASPGRHGHAAQEVGACGRTQRGARLGIGIVHALNDVYVSIKDNVNARNCRTRKAFAPFAGCVQAVCTGNLIDWKLKGS